jgi:hypothetical protein
MAQRICGSLGNKIPFHLCRSGQDGQKEFASRRLCVDPIRDAVKRE